MSQIDQELDNQEAHRLEQARQTESAPVGHSPSLQELRDWLQDAQINQRPPNYLQRIQELSVDFLQDTPLANQPVQDRDPQARNPAFVLSKQAQTWMERDRVESERRRTPTRQVLLSWYSAARVAGQSTEVLAHIQKLGQAQIVGTVEANKLAGERSLEFRNPELVLGRGEYKTALHTIQSVLLQRQQQRSVQKSGVERGR